MNDPRVGLIGFGNMGKNHARILDNLQEIDFIGIYDPALTDGYYGRNRKFFTNLSDLFAQNLDYVVVATPTNLHEEISIKAMSEGVAILLEKPISLDLDSALRIRESAEHHEVLVGVGHIERYNPAAKELRSKIEEGFLGDVHQISTIRQGPNPLRISDVGVVRDLATHDVDLVFWVLNSRYREVYAKTRKRESSLHEDYMLNLGVLVSGVLVSNIVNWRSPTKERRVIVNGENGVLVADLLKSELTFYENGRSLVTQNSLAHLRGDSVGEVIGFSFNKSEPLLIEHENFRDQYRGQGSGAVTLNDAIHSIQVTDAILNSALKNSVEYIKNNPNPEEVAWAGIEPAT
jgi:UDP-N-acetylglucosamine 3-dehydrogenase